MELDPSQFLAQGSSDSDSENDDAASRTASTPNGNGPSFLTSLGLTHINSVTPSQYGSVAVSLKKVFDQISIEISKTIHNFQDFLRFS